MTKSPWRVEFDARYAAEAAEARKSLPAHALAAADELLALDAPVYLHLAGENGAHFIVGAERRSNDEPLWCDYYQEEVIEAWSTPDKSDPSRRILNDSGIRTEMLDILDKHGLFAEWINPGQVGVFNA